MILNEHGPRDLLKAYYNNASGYSFTQWWDLEKTKFKELSKEEALDYADNEDNDLAYLHILIGRFLVLLDNRTGYGSDVESVYVPKEKGYTDQDGKLIRWTSGMPAEHIIKIADKIYLVDPVERGVYPNRNEHRATTDGVAQTALNSFVGKYSPRLPRGLNDAEYYKDGVAGYSYSTLLNVNTKDAIKAASNLAKATHDLEKYQTELEHALKVANGNQNDPTVHALKQDVKKAQERVDIINQQIKHDNNVAADSKAAARYAASMKDLQGKLNSKLDALRQLRVLKARMNTAERKIDNVKQNGADSTILKKKQLKDANDMLSQLKFELDMVEDGLEDTSEADAMELQEVQDKYDDINGKLKQLEDNFLNKFNQIKNHARR